MPVVPRYDDDLRLAHVLADAVERTTMAWFGNAELEVSTKSDRTLVSNADREAEEVLRHQLSRTRPRDMVVGEEMETTGSGPRRWILDPIDGTNNFIRGVPVWATLIALVEDDTAVLGLVAAPALGRRWWAGLGSGAWSGRSLSSAKRIHVSDTSVIEHASLAYSSLKAWTDPDQRSAFEELVDDCWRTRGYGDFWSHMLVAEGAVDIAVEPVLALHDMAALSPIVTEAGGMFTDLDGTPGPFGRGAISSNGLLHEVTVGRLDL